MTAESRTWTTVFDSPVGPLRLTSDGHALTGVLFNEPAPDDSWVEDDAPFAEVIGELREYFAGARTTFDVPIRSTGTAFQKTVWAALRDIPYGETRSYGQLAEAIGNPNAVRAVGLANSRNPISIIVPCHRVIGSNGSLTGYSGGLDRKRTLLDLERAAPAWSEEPLPVTAS
jgi:methylated-DNA-[protein]-cysteine S-methyltransferase